MALKSALKAICPPIVWAIGRRTRRALSAYPPMRNALFHVRDVSDRLRGRIDPLVPPRALQHLAGGDFFATGAATFRQLLEWGEVQPTDAVLEVGCGSGRVAIPLTKYLVAPGSYHGFDVNPSCVRWCQSAITPTFPNFQFQTVDVHNGMYHRHGQTPIETFQFPYADQQFDIVYLTSVFTHMLPETCDRYLSEIARVMRPRGRCMATFFLMNIFSQTLIEQGFAPEQFVPQPGGFWTTNPRVPEQAIALPEVWLHERLAAHKLTIERNERGSWCGRQVATAHEDVLVLRKW